MPFQYSVNGPVGVWMIEVWNSSGWWKRRVARLWPRTTQSNKRVELDLKILEADPILME